MGLWVPRPALDDGEEIVTTATANHTQSIRAVGGRIFVTNRNLRFVASRFDRLLGGTDLVIPRAEVRTAEVAERSLEGGPFTGGLRRRLHVVTGADGEFFVVNRAESLADLLRDWAAADPPP